MHISDIIGKLESNRIWINFWFLHWQKLHLQPLATFLNFCFMQIWSVNYSLHFENVQIHKHCLYWKVFSTDIYRKSYFNSLLLFSYICWSVNCMNWVSKFNNFFLTCMETEARFMFEGFNIFLYVKLISDSPIPFLLFLWGL